MAVPSTTSSLTREDLRFELQEFLQDVRREVSNEVCQSLLPDLRQLIAEHRRASTRFSSLQHPRGSRRFGELAPRNSCDSDLGSLKSRQLTKDSASTSSEQLVLESERKHNAGYTRMIAGRKPGRKSVISVEEVQKEAQKLTQTLGGVNAEDKSYMLLGVDDDADREEAEHHRASSRQSGGQSKVKDLQRSCRKFVRNEIFEQFIGVAVLANAVSLGYDTQYWADHREDHKTSRVTYVTEFIFCVLFTSELSLRLFAYGFFFFQMDTWAWNLLDSFLVILQVTEQILRLVSLSIPMNFGILRLLRVLRIIRVTRLVRSFHLFDDLRVIASSVVNSASSLGWSLILLGILMYIFSLVFLQIILNAGETEHGETLRYWFGSLYRTYFTMFECIVGGVSWDEVASPLMDDIGPFASCLFSLYISCSLFAMMNLLTGVFVDKAMKTVREDKDVVLAKRIRDLFLGRDPEEKEEAPLEITWEMFLQKLDTNVMQDYLKQINVELAQGKALFSLLDADGSGAIDSDEIVEGCLKLRGPARSLDLALLSRDVHSLTIIANEVKLYMVKIMEEMSFPEESLRFFILH